MGYVSCNEDNIDRRDSSKYLMDGKIQTNRESADKMDIKRTDKRKTR